MKRRAFLKMVAAAPAALMPAWAVPIRATNERKLIGTWPGTLPNFEHAYTADDLESTTIRANQIKASSITDLITR
jgi:hypothetical protein